MAAAWWPWVTRGHEVAIHPSLRHEPFQVGDAVALAQDGNVIVQRLTHYRPPGRVTTVRGWHQDRLRVDFLADQTLLIDVTPSVANAQPREGDQVLVHEDWKIALELVERADDVKRDRLDPIPLDQIGGLDDVIAELLLDVESRFLHPERTAELGLAPLGGITLVGPPGAGKTLLVRGLVSHLQREFGQRIELRECRPRLMARSLFRGQRSQGRPANRSGRTAARRGRSRPGHPVL